MRVAVLGVGLIGGSIGLAARRSLGAEVIGFDPEPANAERGLELGALDRIAASVAEAARGAEIVYCAAPVGSLPALVCQALEASDAEAVVTDVGSTKRELVAGIGAAEAAERFIGGHPLAGAESAGVANARADLFEGARWYLTPTQCSCSRPPRRPPRSLSAFRRWARASATRPASRGQIRQSGRTSSPPTARRWH